MKKSAILFFTTWLGICLPVFSQTLFDAFQRVKKQFEEKNYELSLSTIDSIEMSLRTTNSSEASKIEPALKFYRAANYAMLGDAQDATAAFRDFLKLAPNTTLDPSVYGKPVIEAFKRARREDERERPLSSRPDKHLSGIEAAYANFTFTAVDENGPNGDFVRGPLGLVMTKAERDEWNSLDSDAARAAFIIHFWARRNPQPGKTPNTMREELDKRIAFADASFGQEETRGATTDRGMVFVLLGPPSYIGKKPLTSADDPAVGQKGSDLRPPPPGSAEDVVKAYNIAEDTNPTMNFRADTNFRETWHYLVLPAGFPAHQADFDFITRKGIGQEQLSRDAKTIRVLDAARKNFQVVN